MGPEKTVNQQHTPHSPLQRNNPGYAPAVSPEASPSMPAQCHRLSQPSFDWQSPRRFPESHAALFFMNATWVSCWLVMRDTRELSKQDRLFQEVNRAIPVTEASWGPELEKKKRQEDGWIVVGNNGRRLSSVRRMLCDPSDWVGWERAQLS